MRNITACPKCKRHIEAKDYMNRAIVGMLESILPKIECRCGYQGLPIKLSIKDYEKWIKT